MSFNVQQQKVINHYREMYNIASIISDDVVVDMIIRDMIHSGKVYAGFESLVQGAAVNRQNNDNKTGVFGFGFNNDGNMELAFKNNTSEYLTLLPTRKESQALSFMQRILKESENTLAEREKDAGPVSAFTNFVRTISFNKYSKRSVKKEIEKFEKQLEEIERAAKGEKVHKDFLGNVSTITFKDEFKRVRGVEFNADKITATIEKSSEIANIRNCYQSVQAVKELLGYSSSGIYNITHPQEATAAILQAFEVLGVTKGEDKANLLKQIFEQYKDHPVMKEYNCKGLTFDKNQNGEYCIYRWLDYEGNSTEAPIEVIRLIVNELANRLDKTLATGLNIEFDENTSSEELSKLCNESISKHEEEYQKMFAESFGGKNVKELSDEYVLKQQQDVATFEMVGNMICMGLMLVPGGVTATSGWLLKTGKFAQTAQKMAKAGAALTKVQKFASPIIMGSMILSPTQLIEQGFSENGLSDEELEEWKNRVVQNSIYMAAGMASSSIAAKCAAQYKTARLVHTLKASGKSFDEIQAMIKANPAQFSDDIVAEFSKISKQGMYGQIGGEIALDVSSTVALNLIMGNGTLTSTEVINSIIFAFSGGALQKQFAPLSTETKIAFLMDNFKDYGITYSDAEHILKTLDDISSGKGVNRGVNNGVKSGTNPEVKVTADADAEVKTDTNPDTQTMDSSEAKSTTKTKSETETEDIGFSDPAKTSRNSTSVSEQNNPVVTPKALPEANTKTPRVADASSQTPLEVVSTKLSEMNREAKVAIKAVKSLATITKGPRELNLRCSNQERIEQFEYFLKSSDTATLKRRYSKIIVLDNNMSLEKSDNRYRIEVSADTFLGYDTVLLYDKLGNLCELRRCLKNEAGQNIERIITCDIDGKPKLISDRVYDGNHIEKEIIKDLETNTITTMKVRGRSRIEVEENFNKEARPGDIAIKRVTAISSPNIDTRKILVENIYYDGTIKSIEILNDDSSIIRDSSGLILHDDVKITQEEALNLSNFDEALTKVEEEIELARQETISQYDKTKFGDPKNFELKVNKNRYGGTISIQDEFGNIAGTVGYTIHPDQVYFLSFQSFVDGAGVGTKLINELVKIADEEGLKLTATADASLYANPAGKHYTNLGFYYKMGFRAMDPQIDELILDCIKNNREIPTALNCSVDIEYKKEPAKSNIEEISTNSTAKKAGNHFTPDETKLLASDIKNEINKHPHLPESIKNDIGPLIDKIQEPQVLKQIMDKLTAEEYPNIFLIRDIIYRHIYGIKNT